MTTRPKVGIVMFQLGGPDSLEAVEPFLFNLFNDPDIIDLPFGRLIRKPLARLIARRRSAAVAHHYEEIGGRSPILLLTERQARALERALAAEMDASCVMAMRYWHPFTADAVKALQKLKPERIVLLPLYPQYSYATTGSSVNEWSRQFQDNQMPVALIRDFHAHALYIDAVADKIRLSLSHFASPGEVDLVFSAHGLPQSFIARGDPYEKQVQETVRLVMKQGGWSNRHHICYQSKVGRQKWLEPSLDAIVERLASEGRKQMLVCPVSFVTEHIETLHEINMETRAAAANLGIEQFEMVPALNDSPKFIAALADLVRRAVNP